MDETQIARDSRNPDSGHEMTSKLTDSKSLPRKQPITAEDHAINDLPSLIFLTRSQRSANLRNTECIKSNAALKIKHVFDLLDESNMSAQAVVKYKQVALFLIH